MYTADVIPVLMYTKIIYVSLNSLRVRKLACITIVGTLVTFSLNLYVETAT